MSARAGGAASLRSCVAQHPDIKVALAQRVGALMIWHVNGRIIRDHVFIDFTEGGNSHAYAWMPMNEIWLDHDVAAGEVGFVKLHELHEFNRMAGGMDYETAHKAANVVERAARADPDKLRDLWAAEVAKLKAR
jgi:hypothetical protein